MPNHDGNIIEEVMALKVANLLTRVSELEKRPWSPAYQHPAFTTDELGGWLLSPFTWTYGNAGVFTAVGDWRHILLFGTKLRLTQTTDKYFSVKGTDYSGGLTYVEAYGGTNYSLANAAIVNPFYSHKQVASGFPHWFDWTPSFTGLTGSPTITARIKLAARIAYVQIVLVGSSSSVMDTTYISNLPFTVNRYGLASVEGSTPAIFAQGTTRLYTPTWTSAPSKVITGYCEAIT